MFFGILSFDFKSVSLPSDLLFNEIPLGHCLVPALMIELTKLIDLLAQILNLCTIMTLWKTY